MIGALTKIGFGADAVVVGPGGTCIMDANVTLRPREPNRPYVHDWKIIDRHGYRFLELDMRWMAPPRGAA